MVTVLLGDRKGEDQSDPGRKACGDGGRGQGDAALSQGCPEAPGAGRGGMQSPLQLCGVRGPAHTVILDF